MVVDDVVGGVLRLADLLQDHGALALELDRIEDRVLQDIGENVDREADIRFQHLGVIGGVLARGIGVELAPHRLDLGGDGERRAARGAFEGHVLKEMRDTVDRLRLVARADIDPDSEADGLDTVHPVGNDSHAVFEAGELDAHRLAPSLAWVRMKPSMASRSLLRLTSRSGSACRLARRDGISGATPQAP